MTGEGRSWRLGAAAAPMLFAVPVGYALAASLRELVGIDHPFFGDFSGTTADARAFQLGNPLYQDPDVGYTPLVYTPLLTLLTAGLDSLQEWEGWSAAVSMAAVGALVALAAHLAYRGRSPSRPEAVAAFAGALGMGAFAFWLVAFVPFNFLYAPRPDQLSWALALIGLVLVPSAAGGSRRSALPAILLLSGAVWTKQPAGVAIVAAGTWLALAAATGRVSPRRAAVLAGAVVAVNGAAFAVLHLATAGWSTEFIVDMPADRDSAVGVGRSIEDLVESVAVAALVTLALWVTVALRRTVPLARDGRVAEAPVLQVAAILALFVVLDIAAAVEFRRAVGAAHNQFVGIAWGLGLLSALAYGLAQASRRSSLLAAAIVLALFAVSESGRLADALDDALPVAVHVPPKDYRAFVALEPEALRAYARRHSVYHPIYPWIGASRARDVYPGQDNVQGLASSGRASGHLERALLERRFDLVFPFQDDDVRGERPGYYGRWEDNYLWKLNAVIAAKYQPAVGLPAGVAAARAAPGGAISPPPVQPRPGPDPAPWMRDCFGSFEIAGVKWRIARGGGFWCRRGGRGSVLALALTPAPMSEIRADEVAVDAHSRVVITLQRPGVVEVTAASGLQRRQLAAGQRWSAAIRADGPAAVGIRASRGSGARVDVGQLRR